MIESCGCASERNGGELNRHRCQRTQEVDAVNTLQGWRGTRRHPAAKPTVRCVNEPTPSACQISVVPLQGGGYFTSRRHIGPDDLRIRANADDVENPIELASDTISRRRNNRDQKRCRCRHCEANGQHAPLARATVRGTSAKTGCRLLRDECDLSLERRRRETSPLSPERPELLGDLHEVLETTSIGVHLSRRTGISCCDLLFEYQRGRLLIHDALLWYYFVRFSAAGGKWHAPPT